MLVRLHLRPPAISLNWPDVAEAIGSVMTVFALIAFTASFWAFAAEFKGEESIAATGNAFARGESWIGMAALLLLFARFFLHLASSKFNISSNEKSRLS